jgi:hypothetical protein
MTGESVARAGYESLLTRRRRRERRRRRAIAAAVLGAGFGAGVLLVRSTGATAVSNTSQSVPPAVAAGASDGSLLLARYEPKAIAHATRAAAAAEIPIAKPAPPPVPDEVLATLPPSARLAADGSPAWPASLAEAPRDRVIERSEITGADGMRAPIEIEYTLDAQLTQRVVGILDQVELGHVIVMDPRDGRILTYASTDPRSFPPTRVYPAASLMKVVTSAALLRRTPDVTQRICRFIGSPYYLTQNLLDPPSRGHTASFVDALATSNNQCFAQIAVHEVGSVGVIDQMQNFGLLESPGPGHQAGEVDPVHDRLELGKLGSGLAGSRISPLAAARMAAALVDGQVVTPRWIARVRDANGGEFQVPEAAAPRSALSPEITNELRSMMIQTTVRGTARRAFHARDGSLLLDPVPVAGKTGSLNGLNPDGRYEWFIGIAPADDPKIVIATLVVNRGKWHRSATQVAAQVLQAVFCESGDCRAEAPALHRTAGRRDPGDDRG